MAVTAYRGHGRSRGAADKLGNAVTLDVMRPLQAYDAGGRARALTAVVKALSEAKV